VHRAAEDVRALYCADDLPPQRLDAATRQCEALWTRRHAVLRSLEASQVPDIRADLQDLAVCTASLELRAADEAQSAPGRHHALHLLEEAEAEFGPSAVIELERGGVTVPSPRTAWEHTAVGRALLRRGQLTAASAELRAAVALDPAGRWCNFYYGICAARQGQPHDAVAAFSVAIGTGPDVPEFFHNRAQAYRALGRSDEARRDNDRAAQLHQSR
jgi:predicted Zn-dependent protease